mgnify:CR=1 FL=1
MCRCEGGRRRRRRERERKDRARARGAGGKRECIGTKRANGSRSFIDTHLDVTFTAPRPNFSPTEIGTHEIVRHVADVIMKPGHVPYKEREFLDQILFTLEFTKTAAATVHAGRVGSDRGNRRGK